LELGDMDADEFEFGSGSEPAMYLVEGTVYDLAISKMSDRTGLQDLLFLEGAASDSNKDTPFNYCLAVMLAYSITSRRSFEEMDRWHSAITAMRIAASSKPTTAPLPIIVVGLQIDREDERQVATDEAKAFALKHNYLFTEASAKSGVGVDAAFGRIAEEIDMLRIAT
jgi:hypothetical protein